MSETASLRMTLSLPETIYWTVAATMAATFALTLILATIDDRTIDGTVSVWAKPLKFDLSLAIHAATLALVLAALSTSVRTGPVMVIVAIIFVTACILEMGYIIGQAARAEQSHFNISTPFHRAMWSMMALAAIVIIGAAAAIGIATALDTESDIAPALRWAIVIGLIGGTLLTLYTAFTIGARMSPYIGALPTHDARMALTSWSQAGGDLRVSHFLATHMIQALPLLGLVVVQFAPGRLGVTIVVVAAIAWSIITLVEYARALSGNPSPLALFAS